MDKRQLRAVEILFVAFLVILVTVYNTNKNAMDDAMQPRRLSTKNNVLEYVHITKTGGTTIERAACLGGITWGSMHYINIYECHGKDTEAQKSLLKEDVYDEVSPWHTPPRIMNRRITNSSMNPYTGSKLFTVVRNPYTRWVSEYYCPHNGFKGSDKDNEDYLNMWITSRIRQLQTSYGVYHRRQISSTLPWKIVPPAVQKHFINQYEYVYDFNGQRLIDHVIHHEHMKQEFDDLMIQYDYNLTLPSRDEMHTLQTTPTKGRTKMTWKNLRDSTVLLINTFAAGDFGAFGYKAEYSIYQSETYSPEPYTAVCINFKPGEARTCSRKLD